MLIEQQTTNQNDLDAINRLTLREFKADEVFTFQAKLIDNTPTSNGRIWTCEWQVANVNNFIGVPVIVNHENNQQLVLGRVYEATQNDNAIHGKVYVPLDTDVGRNAKAKIESGLFKSVSIGANADNVTKEGDHIKIMPGKNDRVFEVSFVAIPGCFDCGVVKEHSCGCKKESAGTCKSDASQKAEFDNQNQDTSMLAFASEQLRELQNEYVRLAGLLLEMNRLLSESIAASLSPKTLKELTAKLREQYVAKNKLTESVDDVQGESSGIAEALQLIRKAKGV